MKIGAKIRRIREIKQLSEVLLAKAIGISIEELERIELDQEDIGLEQLWHFSQALNVSIEELISIDESLSMSQFNLNKEVIEATRMSFEMKRLYEEKIALLEEKIRSLEKELGRD